MRPRRRNVYVENLETDWQPAVKAVILDSRQKKERGQMEEKEVQLKRKRGKSDMWAGNVKIF
jgi:hypothetical protein